MSFSLNVPLQANHEEFQDALYAARATPKIDGRSKIGRRQNELVSAAKAALSELSYEAQGPCHGNISGHVNADLTGSVAVTLFFDPEAATE